MENPSEVYFGYTLTIYCCLEDETMMERPYVTGSGKSRLLGKKLVLQIFH